MCWVFSDEIPGVSKMNSEFTIQREEKKVKVKVCTIFQNRLKIAFAKTSLISIIKNSRLFKKHKYF